MTLLLPAVGSHGAMAQVPGTVCYQYRVQQLLQGTMK